MALNTLNSELIGNMFLAGVSRLNAEKEMINELNVFPVPDGDTGTNMSMTMLSAAREVKKLDYARDMAGLCRAIATGSLGGARGNSGVIMSQLLRGFTRTLAEHREADTALLALAFTRGVDTAYKAVMKPKEGTILTVAREMAKKASEICAEVTDVTEFARQVIEQGEKTLAATPDMLPVLKEAGVVDSGGQGLILVLRGALDLLEGRVSLEELSFEEKGSAPASTATGGAAISEADIRFGYCTEFIIRLERSLNPKTEKELKAYLETIGDSIVCVSMDDIVKVHVHTNDPGLAIQKALKYGQLSCIKIDNMRLEHHERVLASDELRRAGVRLVAGDNEEDRPADAEEKPYGFISVSAGEGMKDIFEGLGADYIIPGGQTMNPSTRDMQKAIANVNARTIFILPNNKNVILAANQAAELTKDRDIRVVPTATLPQGIAALIAFDESADPEENVSSMKEAARMVKTGQVTYAVRDTHMEGRDIKQGDIMGIGDSTILAAGSDREEVTLEMIGEMVDEDSSFIAVYYGEDVKDDEAAALAGRIKREYPDLDVELSDGGQPIYYYMVSVE